MNKILLVTAFKPSKIAAGENYTRQLISDLSRSCRLDLIYFEEKYTFAFKCENVRVLKVFSSSLLRKGLNAAMRPFLFPLFTVRFNLSRLRFIREAVSTNNYKLVICDFSQTFLFSRYISGVPVILNMHDVIYQRYKRLYYGIFSSFVRLTERWILNWNYKEIFSFSEKDKQILSDLYGKKSNVNSFYFDRDILETLPECVGDYFVFFGNWKRKDNNSGLRRFLKETLPELQGEVKIKIIGPSLPLDIVDIVGKVGLEYLGFINNPYQVLANSKALIAPIMTGAGVKVKVLESLACGTPVIGFPMAFEGISQLYDDYKIEVNSFNELATAMNKHEISLHEKLALRQLVCKAYSINPLAEFIKSVISS